MNKTLTLISRIYFSVMLLCTFSILQYVYFSTYKILNQFLAKNYETSPIITTITKITTSRKITVPIFNLPLPGNYWIVTDNQQNHCITYWYHDKYPSVSLHQQIAIRMKTKQNRLNCILEGSLLQFEDVFIGIFNRVIALDFFSFAVVLVLLAGIWWGAVRVVKV